MQTIEERKTHLMSFDPTLTEEQATKKAEAFAVNLYGSMEAYEGKVQEHQNKQAQEENDRVAITNIVGISDDDVQTYEQNAELNSRFSEEARTAIESKKVLYMGQGKTEQEAEALAIVDIRKDFNHSGKPMYESVNADKEIKELADKYPDIVNLKNEVKAIMNTKGMSVLQAYKEVRESQAKKTLEYQRLSDEEKAYYENLTQTDRIAYEALKAVQPEANWTPSKYYVNIYGNKPLAKEVPEIASKRRQMAIDEFKNSYPWKDLGIEEKDLKHLSFDKETGKVIFDNEGLPMFKL